MYARILAFSNGDLVSLYDRSDGFFRRQLILTTKRKTFVEYLSANEEKLGIHYTPHLTNSAGREVRGFRGIGSIISPSGYMQGGWQKVAPDDNPFKDA